MRSTVSAAAYVCMYFGSGRSQVQVASAWLVLSSMNESVYASFAHLIDLLIVVAAVQCRARGPSLSWRRAWFRSGGARSHCAA